MGPGQRALIIAALAAGCGGGGGPAATADARPRVDASTTCVAESAVLGRCYLAGTQTDCAGVAGEDRDFVVLAADDPVPVVVGPQGASMFVLALRTSGIEPGDPADPTSPTNPDVNITLLLGDAQMAVYRGRPAFIDSTTDLGSVEAAGLYAVADGPGSEMVGRQMLATARVEDMNGEQRCGSVNFVAQ